jgi:hypothetical protein
MCFFWLVIYLFLAQYGTIIRNWGNQSASSMFFFPTSSKLLTYETEANLSMLEKKNLLPLVALHKNNNVKVQSVASEVIDALVELRMSVGGTKSTFTNLVHS